MTEETSYPRIAIAGRPNVGKSALFNLLTGEKRAIVHEHEGVTRDNITASVDSHHGKIIIADTGGICSSSQNNGEDVLTQSVENNAISFISSATYVIWVVDAQEGITGSDEEIAQRFREEGLIEKTVIAPNKADNNDLLDAAYAEFASLGLPEIIPVSCEHNVNIDTLWDHCLSAMPSMECPSSPETTDTKEGPDLRLGILGQPNVGKSSFINRLLGEARILVHQEPGTTRDAVNIPLEIMTDEETFALDLVDTAGMGQKHKMRSMVEYLSRVRVDWTFRRTDAVLFVTDALSQPVGREQRLARQIADRKMPCIILVNKWDMVADEDKKETIERRLRQKLPSLDYAPIVFASAKTGKNLSEVMEAIQILREGREKSIPTASINRLIRQITLHHSPPSKNDKRLKIYYGTMIGTMPPRFLLFVNDKQLCPSQHLQYLERQFREAFFQGTGMTAHILLRNRDRKIPDEVGLQEV